MIIPLLLAIAQPSPSIQLCVEMTPHLYHAVEQEIINQEQAELILARCIVNYSTGPNPHYPDEVTTL